MPINSLNKYLLKIEELGYAYHVYSVDKEKVELVLEKEQSGKKHYTQANAYEDDVYLEALKKRYEQKRNE